jgi:hypothetical protein
MSAFDPLRTFRISIKFGRMRPDLYLRGVRLRLQSPLAPNDIAARVNQAVAPSVTFDPEVVAGGVRNGHLHLRYQRNLFDYNAKPSLAGNVVASGTGSFLDLRFRAPAWAIVFLLAWYAAMLLVGLSVASEQLPWIFGL